MAGVRPMRTREACTHLLLILMPMESYIGAKKIRKARPTPPILGSPHTGQQINLMEKQANTPKNFTPRLKLDPSTKKGLVSR